VTYLTEAKKNGKIISLDFDALTEKSGTDYQCFELSERTVSILLSLLEFQTWGARWHRINGFLSDVEKKTGVQYAQTAMFELMQSLCDGSDCRDMALYRSNIEWIPQNPFTEPYLTPDGYTFAPFYVAPETNLIGARQGDIVTDLARLPYNSLLFGFPRLRITFSMARRIEITLVPVYAGGVAQCQLDGDFGSIRYVDLNRDLTAIPPETNDEIIIKYEFIDEDAHFLDITFLPQVSEEIIGFGGGIRSILICGLEGDDLRELELRSLTVDGCQQHQWRYVGDTDLEWRNLGLPICPGADGSNGYNGDDGVCPECDEPPASDTGGVDTPPAGGVGVDVACQVANSLTDFVISRYRAALEGYADQVVGLGMGLVDFGRWLVSTVLFSFVASPVYIFAWLLARAGADAAQLYTDSGIASNVEDIRCSLYCLLPANGDLTAATLASWKADIQDFSPFGDDLVLMMDAIPLYELRVEAIAAVTFNTAYDCSMCECDCYIWDFVALGTNGGWGLFDFSVLAGTQNKGVYTAGVGWEDTYNSGRGQRGIAIFRGWTGSVSVSRIEVVYDAVAGTDTDTGGSLLGCQVRGRNGSTAVWSSPDGGFGTNITLIYEPVGSPALTELRLESTTGTSTSTSPADRGGSITVKSIKVICSDGLEILAGGALCD